MIDAGIAGRVALVTGANHGIGAAIARTLAAEGAPVFATYLRLPPENDPGIPPQYDANRGQGAADVIDAITNAGGRAVSFEADLADDGTIPRLFDEAERHLGPVEILVNNATAWAADTFLPEHVDRFGRTLHPLTAQTYDLHFAVNSRAAALLIAEFSRRHIERGATRGRIISLTTGGSAGFPQEVSYGASKNALESYTVAAAWELGRYGITANVVCPAATDTGWLTPDTAASIAESSPLRHVGSPEEVADVVLFLASDAARAVTGQKISLS